MGDETIDNKTALSLQELCDKCHITPDFLQALIEYGAVEPSPMTFSPMLFDEYHVLRVQRVVRLQEDLEVNLPGAALAIDLLDQIDQLNSQISLLMQHLIIAKGKK